MLLHLGLWLGPGALPRARAGPTPCQAQSAGSSYRAGNHPRKPVRHPQQRSRRHNPLIRRP
eukprot:3513801-Pyramimonas_sp.AAC.1